MKKRVVLTAALMLTAAVQTAPAQSRLYSTPLLPSEEALNRVNLKLAWRGYLPVESSRDGIATVQVLGDHMYVQLLNGAVVALNADTGQALWRTRVGQPYKVTHPLGFNFETVFVYNGARLFALDRASGKVKFQHDLPNYPSAAPVADSERLYVPLTGNRFKVFLLPQPEAEEEGKPRPTPSPEKPAPPSESTIPLTLRRSALGQYYGVESRMTTVLSDNRYQQTFSPLASAGQMVQGRAGGYQLPLIWEYFADARIDLTPLVTLRKKDDPGYLLLPTAAGTIYGTSKVQKVLVYSFQTDTPVASMGQYGDIGYLVYQDGTLVAMHIATGHILWRQPLAAASRRKPEVTDEDIYLTVDRAGLYRLNRGTGEVIWQNVKAERFLSYNRKFVYALDSRNRLLILDRARGIQLAALDMRDFTVPIPNDFTDRLFLAANDGLLACFHDREYAAPVYHKQLLEEPKPGRRMFEAKPEEKKE